MRAIYYTALLSVSVVFTLSGFILWGRDFGSNLFAEIAGMFASIAIGFLLVDRIIEREARRKWQRVSGHTLESTYHYLLDIHFACTTLPPLMHLRANACGEYAASFRYFADYLANNAETLGAAYRGQEIIVDPDMKSDMQSVPLPNGETEYRVRTSEQASSLRSEWLDEQSSSHLYREMEPVFDRLRDVITPRVIDFDYEPDLAAALVAVESAERNWRSSLKLIEDDWGFPEAFAWGGAALLLNACADLVDELDKACERVGVNPSHRLEALPAREGAATPPEGS